jgi:hypothetical protein
MTEQVWRKLRWAGLGVATASLLVNLINTNGLNSMPVAQASTRVEVTKLEAVAADAAVSSVTAIAAPVFHYQGRLLDPVTGAPKPNGLYAVVFRLYNSPTGGVPLWNETKSMTVTNGAFNTLLGDVTAFNQAHFNGQSLWLGITVGADPEATPRQQLASVAYAFYANDAAKLGGQAPSEFAARAHTHTGATVVDGSLNAADIADRVRNISFPAQVLNRDPNSTIITGFSLGSFGAGLRWQANFANGAYLILAKPSDWDGGTVTLKLHFYAITAGAGNVAFFIRPRAYNAGDLFDDVGSVNAPAVPLSQQYQIGEQVFTIPAARFGNDNLWVITLQRGGTGETYTGDVMLAAVELIYTAVQ